MNIYHTHHIVPKHMGGTDDPSNLIKLTIEEHAAAHKKLWEDFGNEYDRIAWLGLSNMIDKQEVIFLTMSENGKRNSWHMNKSYKNKDQQRNKALKMWQMSGMHEHLSQKRKEQSANGKNPMQGKQQKKVCCLKCQNIISVNGLKLHQQKCY